MPLFYKSNRTGVAFDAALVLRATTDAPRNANGADGTKQLYPESFGNNAAVVLDIQATSGGTFDAGNFWTITVETSADGTNFNQIASHKVGAAVTTAYRAILPISGALVDQMGGAAVQTFIRTSVTKTGTTAPALDFNAYVSPVV